MPADQSLERVMPFNLEAERAVLGAILLHPPALFEVCGLLFKDHFYYEAHRNIFQAILDLQKAEIAIDLITLKDLLTRNVLLEACGGAAFLASLTDGMPKATNVKYYSGIVREYWVKRQVIKILDEGIKRGYESEFDSTTIIESTQGELLKLSQSFKTSGPRRATDFVHAAFSQIEEINSQKKIVTGLTTGFRDLDRLTGGFCPQQFIIIAARPSHGKTTLSQNIASNLAMRWQKRVVVFSLEMAGIELAKRTICSETPVDSYELPAGRLEWSKIGDVCNQLCRSQLWIDESAGLSILELRARAQRLTIEHGLDLIVVDYLQLMAGSGYRDSNREREISEISRGLKVLAKDLNIPVIALSQLNREIEKTTRRPQLSDLRESGSLEQDADLVLFIWRDELRARTIENEGKAELIIAKQRNGRAGVTINLEFDKCYCRFRDAC